MTNVGFTRRKVSETPCSSQMKQILLVWLSLSGLQTISVDQNRSSSKALKDKAELKGMKGNKLYGSVAELIY